MDVFGANLGAALRDVAESDTELVFQQPRAGQAVEWMHFKAGNANEETRSAELFLFGVVAKDVADVLAEEALDALIEFLHTLHVALVHLPLDAGPGLERRDFPVHFVVPGDVGNEILDQRKSFHGEDCDGLIERERIHARLASEPGPAIHLSGTRSAFPCL